MLRSANFAVPATVLGVQAAGFVGVACGAGQGAAANSHCAAAATEARGKGGPAAAVGGGTAPMAPVKNTGYLQPKTATTTAKGCNGERSLSCERWASAVTQAQSRNTLDFEMISNAQQRELCFRKCKAAKGLAVRARALVAESLMQMSEASGGQEHEDIRSRCAKAATASRERCDRRYNMLERVQEGTKSILRAGHSMDRSRSPSIESEHALRGASSSEESAMHETERLLGARGSMSRWDDVDDDSSSGSDASSDYSGFIGERPSGRPTPVDSLLRQLRTEPFDDRERAAKFGLYEAYLAEVESMRSVLFKFYEESRPLQGEAMRHDMDRQLGRIDDREKMGVTFQQAEWFVYHMMRQASRNNNAMASMLHSWEEKLRPITERDQPTCPVCLEKFAPHRLPETLGCCHKVCKPCWSMWTKFMHAMNKKAFCPCCHHAGFLGALNQIDDVAQEVEQRTPPGTVAISTQSRGRSPAPPSKEQYTESDAPPQWGVTAEARAPPPPARLFGKSTKMRL